MTSAMISLSLLLVLLFSTVASASPTPGVLHIPLTRRSDDIRDVKFYSDSAIHLRERYNYRHENQSHRRAVGRSSENLITQRDFSYYGIVGVGTPAQYLHVAFDTGSSDVWVLNPTHEIRNPPRPGFHSSASASFKKKKKHLIQKNRKTLHYGSESITGEIATDTFTLYGFTVRSQEFLYVNQIGLPSDSKTPNDRPETPNDPEMPNDPETPNGPKTLNGLQNSPVVGVIGFAFDGVSQTGTVPFLQALEDTRWLARPEMGICLNRPKDSLQAYENGLAGTLTLGGTNPALFQGDIDFPTSSGSSQTFWMLTLTSVIVQKTSVRISSGDYALASIDTGAALIGGPEPDVRAIWDAVPDSEPVVNMPGFWALPCNAKVFISLSFGGTKSWPINQKDLKLDPLPPPLESSMSWRNICARQSSWIIGDTFLKNVYTVFRMSPLAIGFAQLSAAAPSPDSSGSGSSNPSGPLKSKFDEFLSKLRPTSGKSQDLSRPPY
ncbi:aspartic peptidase domain-containing protein [Infundibulicybe gibba]|nr:aspartic peptidase domain-containing protein [Infundibulicybe gibba]